MPRKPRFFLPQVPVHMMVRGNSRGVVYAEEEDYLSYLSFLSEGAALYECSVHAYVLMTNHVHLLVSSEHVESLSKLPQYIGRKYVPYFNRKYGRSGTLWEGRFKANSIDSEPYLLTCYRYIESNPVRAKMVAAPGEYKWSSYRCNADGEKNTIITPHSLYSRLGGTGAQRQRQYRELFDTLTTQQTEALRSGLQTGTPIGGERFIAEIEKLTGSKVGYAKRGRPRKVND